MAKRFSIEAVFKAIDRVTKPVTRMQNRIGKFTSSADRSLRQLSRTSDRFFKKFKRGARNLAVAGTVALTFGGQMLAAGADFEQAITNVGAVQLKTRADISGLEQMALRLGATTKFTATESANAMEILAKSGFNAQQIMQATPGVLDAAAASGLGIAEVANHVSNIIKGMGLEYDQAANVADKLALASSRTNSTIGTLGESMRNVASTARQLNIPLDDTIASVALLQDVGLDASVAGSAFNTMLTKMAKPSASLEKQMKKMNISFKDAEGNMLSLPKVIEQISIGSKKMGGNFNQVAFLAELVGLRGQKAASNLANLFETGKLEKLIADLAEAEGVAKKMADIRMDTTRGSMTLLASAIDAVKVKIFDMNSGALKETVDNMRAWVSANEDLIAAKVGAFLSNLIENIEKYVGWIKTIAKFMFVFWAVNTALQAIAATMAIVNFVMAANPIVLLVLSIIALAAAITVALHWLGKFVALFARLPSPVIAAIAIMTGPIGMLIGAAALIVKHWQPIKSFFKSLWGGIKSAFVSAWETIKGIIASIKQGVEDVLALRGLLTPEKTIRQAGQTLGNAARGVTAPVTSNPLFTFGKMFADEDFRKQFSQNVASPQERTANSINENITTNSAEITLRTGDNTSAEVTGGSLGGNIKVQETGGL